MRKGVNLRSTAFRVYGNLLHASAAHAKALGSMPGARAAHAAVLRHLESPSIVSSTVAGLRLLVHADSTVGRNLLLHGSYEPYETELFLSSIIPDTTVLDIGANVGYYSLLASCAMNNSGRVLSFEPHPELFRLLTCNIEANGSENVVPLNVALTNRVGTIRLFFSSVDRGKHSLSSFNASVCAGSPSAEHSDHVADSRQTPASAIVPAMRLDDVLRDRDLPPVSVVKMDVEGAEHLVFDGATTMLDTAQPMTIFFEFWPDGIMRLGGKPRELLVRLERAGFSLSIIDNRNRRLLPALSNKILRHCNDTHAGQLDLQCVRH